MRTVFAFIAALLISSAVYAQCIVSFPYSENFNGAGWVIPPNTTQTGSLASCWTRNPTTNGFVWVPGPSATINAFTGPVSDFSGNGKFVYTETVSFTNPPNAANILSPQIDLSTAVAPELSFYYYMYGAQIGALSIQVNNGSSNWTTLSTVSGQQQTTNTGSWIKVTQSLAAYAGDTIRLRFVGTKANFSNQSRIAIDQISVQEAPTCAPVTNVYLTNTTASTTQIGWFAGSTSSTSWEIEYGPFGFSQGNGTIITTSNNPETITGLAGSTTYAFYVREVCSPTDKSPWEGPHYTTTSCSSPLSIPYTETFEHPGWINWINNLNPGSLAPCWIPAPTSGFGYQWLVNPNNFNAAIASGPNGDHTTGNGKYVAAQVWTGSALTSVLRSPQIDLSTGTNPQLSFWYHMYGSGIDKLDVEIKPAVGGSWTNLTTITGQQQTLATAPWQQASVSLAAYGNQTVFIRFVAKRLNTTNNAAEIAIDDLSIVSGSGCPQPSGLVVNNITTGSAEVAFTPVGTTGQYEINFGLTGYNINTQGTSVLVSGSPQTITALIQNSTYDVYVRKLCSNDTSIWVGPVTFTTPCIYFAPYTENFDDSDWTTGSQTFPQTIGTIDDCWDRTTNTTYFWMAGPKQFPSFSTGPQNDHTTGSGKFMFANTTTYGGTSPLTADFTTPLINLAPLDTPELSFWYHMFGAQIGSLIVQVNNGSSWVTIKTITGQQQTGKTSAWLEEIINLQAYANDTIRLRFRATKNINTFNTEVAIDDIDIHEIPACPKPDDLLATNPTFNAINLSWVTGGASNWILKYGAPGFTPTTANYAAVNSNPFTLSGLSQNTDYEIWIRDSCGTGSVSDWYGPVFFRTACSPISAPYLENFDGSSFATWSFTDQDGTIDPCFVRSDTNEYYWVVGPGQFTSFQTGPSADHTTGSGKYFYTRTNVFVNGGVNTILQTPWIDLSTLSAPELRFWYHMYGINIDKLQVRVRRFDGTQQVVKTLTGQQQFSSAAAWQEEIVQLANFIDDTVRIIFTGFTTGSGIRAEIAIDDISLNNPQNCAAPTNVALGAITNNSIQVTWNSSSSAAGSIIEYGPAGFSLGAGTIVSNVTSPHTLNGLTQNTAYDVYVRDSCTWGNLSTRVGPVTDTTLQCVAVTAAFTTSATGLAVAFNATTSGGNPDTYSWDFGDGTNGTGVNASHTYATGGAYNVLLIVSNSCGNIDSLTQTIVVCEPLVPAFTFVKTALTVNFDATTTTGTGVQYSWLYGDGNSGSGQTSTHTYSNDGVYTVSLIVSDTCGAVDTLNLSVSACDSLNPQIAFTQNGLVVDFTVSGASSAVNYNWNFGDGNTGTGATPTHTYGVTGTYNVSVVVTNVCGEQATANILVTLCNVPKASWTYSIISSNSSGMKVQFDGTSSIGASSFIWDFGDGNTNNTTAIPVHTYVPAGLFWVVKLTVANDCGDEDFFQSSLAAMGIDDFERVGMTTLPNPADEALILLVPSILEVKKIEIYDSSGKAIGVESEITGTSITIPTRVLSSGGYILKVYTNAGMATYKILVQH